MSFSDWSGTLVDDLMPVVKTTNHVLTSCGLPAMTLQEFRAPVLPADSKVLRAPPAAHAAGEARTDVLAEYPKYHAEISLLPQRWIFCASARGGRWACTSPATVEHAHVRNADGALRHRRLHHETVYRDRGQDSKIHHILDENGLDREETMFVGDMEHDIEAGKAGGIHTCAVLTGYNHLNKLRAMDPDLICNHLGELQGFLVEREPCVDKIVIHDLEVHAHIASRNPSERDRNGC